MSEKIDKLCKLLDNNQTSDLNSLPDGKQKTNLNLTVFQLEQRMSAIESKLGFCLDEENKIGELNDDKQIPSNQLLGTNLNPQQDLLKSKELKRSHKNDLKELLSKHECVLNDLTFRISEVETGMKELDPESIRTLIRNIAVLIIQEEKQEVNAEMDDIKGSQRKNFQLVDLLKEELKNLDERLQKDIERKIERKDLNDTKSQLRRKVYYILKLVKRTRETI